MNSFTAHLGRYARSLRKRRRGWALVAIAFTGWAIVVGLGYGLWRLVSYLI
jgi:hypothetical protein